MAAIPYLPAAPAFNGRNVAGTPVVLTEQDINSATVAGCAMYVHKLKISRLEGGEEPTDDVLALGVVNEHKAASAAGQGAVINSINNLTRAVDNLTHAVGAMDHNSRMRMFNSYQAHLDHALRALQNVKSGGTGVIGATPQMQGAGGVFPNTRRELFELTHANLNDLAAFYQENFGVPSESINGRRAAFAQFVGTSL